MNCSKSCSRIQKNEHYGAITDAGHGHRVETRRGDGKGVVFDETQPLLKGTVVEVREISSEQGDADHLENPTVSLESNGYVFTSTMMFSRLYLPFFLYCLAVGAVAAPKITIILAMICRKTLLIPRLGSIQNDDVCAVPSVHIQMSHFMVYANLISGILCALCGPQICRWSDRYGRKPLIAVSVMGMLLGDLVSVLAASYPEKIAVHWILIEFVFGGLTGAFLTTMALMQSYVADVTAQEQRTAAFGILHACMYLGLGLGPGAGAIFIRHVGKGDMLSIFIVAGACHLIFVLYILLSLPESLPESIRKAKHFEALKSDASSAENGRHAILKILLPLQLFNRNDETDSPRRVNNLRTFAAIDLLAFGVQIGLPPLLVVYSQFRFKWKTVEASLLLSTTNMTRGIVLAVILPLSMWITKTKLISKSNKNHPTATDNPSSDVSTYMHTIRISIILEILGQVGFAMSKSSSLFVLSSAITAAGAPICPVAQSLMTFYVDPSRWGELFGAVSLLHAIGRACIPAFMQMVYGLTVSGMSSVIFWLLSALFGGTLIAALWISPQKQPVKLPSSYSESC